MAGDVCEALTLLENFFAFAFRLPEFMGLAKSVTYHNSSSIDISRWLPESDVPTRSTGEKTYRMLQLKNFVPLDYWRPSLIHRGAWQLDTLDSGWQSLALSTTTTLEQLPIWLQAPGAETTA